MLRIEEAFPNRLAGVIRTENPELAFHACVAASEGGIGTLEITLTVPSCFDVVRGLIASTGGRTPVGVGTVWDASGVAPAKSAGAAFVVAPGLVPEVAAECKRLDILCVLGGLTPTEIHQARLAGADLVKVFPAAAAGGPAYIRQLSGPLPDVPFWVSGGIEIDQIEEYLKLGVKAIGLTTALFPKELLQRGDLDGIRELARNAASVSGVTA